MLVLFTIPNYRSIFVLGHTKTCLFGCEVTVCTVWRATGVQNLNYKLQKRLSDMLPNQQSHQTYVQRCTFECCGTLSGFPLQCYVAIALAFGRGAVAKPSRCFSLQYSLLIALAFERNALARLCRHDQAHRLTVKRLGRMDSHYVSPFDNKSGLTRYRRYPPPELHSGIHISEKEVRGTPVIWDWKRGII